MILDTSMCQNGDRTAAAPHDNPFNFCDATGKGFDSITLPTSGAFKQEVYLGPARIRIFDATGWGATAFADFDPETGTLTNVVVTSRGCDHSDSPTILVDNASGTGTYPCTFALSANKGGGIMKRGAQVANLYGVMTYTGPTCVEEGTLALRTTASVPTNSLFRPLGSGIVSLPGASVLRSVGGTGTIANGAVTATEGVEVYAEDLNTLTPVKISGGPLTFQAGAKVKVFDPANIEDGPGHWPLVTARDPIVGTPELDRTNLKPAYNLAFSADRKTLYLTFPNATLFFLR